MYRDLRVTFLHGDAGVPSEVSVGSKGSLESVVEREGLLERARHLGDGFAINLKKSLNRWQV